MRGWGAAGRLKGHLQKILFALDFRRPTAQWVPWVVALARQWEATIYVVAVAPDMTALSNFYPPHARFQEKVSCKTERMLDLFIGQHLRDLPRVERRMLVGPEADRILEVARQEKVDLIVMGTFGRTGLNRLLYGSVLEKVVKHAPCPVVIVGTES